MRAPLTMILALLAGCAASGGGVRADAPPAAGAGATTEVPKPGTSKPGAATGSIAGRILYPSGPAPHLRICALGAQTSQCTDSPAGRALYRIEHLPDGDYQVVARVEDEGLLRVGGHVQQVQCIRAPCPDQLKTVSVAGGAQAAQIDLNGFYPARDEFPAIP